MSDFSLRGGNPYATKAARIADAKRRKRKRGRRHNPSPAGSKARRTAQRSGIGTPYRGH